MKLPDMFCRPHSQGEGSPSAGTRGAEQGQGWPSLRNEGLPALGGQDPAAPPAGGPPQGLPEGARGSPQVNMHGNDK